MQIEIFTVCQSASYVPNELTINKAFNFLYAPATPARHPALTVVARIRFEPAEAGTHSMEIRIIDFDGRRIAKEVQQNFEIVAGKSESHIHIQLHEIRDLVFPRFDDYSVDLLVDGELTHQIPLFVEQIPTNEV